MKNYEVLTFDTSLNRFKIFGIPIWADEISRPSALKQQTERDSRGEFANLVLATISSNAGQKKSQFKTKSKESESKKEAKNERFGTENVTK